MRQPSKPRRRLALVARAFITSALGAVLLTQTAAAQMVEESLTYEVEGASYEGRLVVNEGYETPRPLVLIVHDWDGPNDYEFRRAQMLAEQGFAAFAIDIYGQDVRPQNPEESRAAASALYEDRPAMRARLEAALEAARALEGIDPERIAVMGYCFGGAAVLELARAGVEIAGLVSFHGGLGLPEGQDYATIASPLLVLHGSADPVSGMDEVAALADDLTEADAEFSMEIYGGALHSFTHWGNSDYHPQADRQSWEALLAFLDRRLN